MHAKKGWTDHCVDKMIQEIQSNFPKNLEIFYKHKHNHLYRNQHKFKRRFL